MRRSDPSFSFIRRLQVRSGIAPGLLVDTSCVNENCSPKWGKKNNNGCPLFVCWSVAVENPAGAVVALNPVAAVHALDANFGTRARGVHEMVVAEINADMREGTAHGVEEHQVARFELAGVNLLSDFAHFLGGTRRRGTDAVLEYEADEAAAVEALVLIVAAQGGNATPTSFLGLAG